MGHVDSAAAAASRLASAAAATGLRSRRREIDATPQNKFSTGPTAFSSSTSFHSSRTPKLEPNGSAGGVAGKGRERGGFGGDNAASSRGDTRRIVKPNIITSSGVGTGKGNAREAIADKSSTGSFKGGGRGGTPGREKEGVGGGVSAARGRETYKKTKRDAN